MIPLSEVFEVSVTELLKCERQTTARYMSGEETESLLQSVIKKKEEDNIRYIRKMLAWYMLCPLGGVLVAGLQNESLHLLYFSLTVIVGFTGVFSQFAYTWWDKDNIRLQAEVRAETKDKRGKYYVSPFFIGLPALLTAILLYFLPIMN